MNSFRLRIDVAVTMVTIKHQHPQNECTVHHFKTKHPQHEENFADDSSKLVRGNLCVERVMESDVSMLLCFGDYVTIVPISQPNKQV